ncbi:hypothetical protein AAMO2058_001342600 [Amorphochlora amoebiformis]
MMKAFLWPTFVLPYRIGSRAGTNTNLHGTTQVFGRNHLRGLTWGSNRDGVRGTAKSARRCLSGSASAVGYVDGSPNIAEGDGIGGQGLVVNPKGAHTATIIWFHGLGDTAEGWLAGALEMCAGQDFVKVILPTAPNRPITLNGGFQMPGWADVYGLGADSREDESGWLESFERAEALINNEIENGIPSHRIVIGGFSMGGAVALNIALRSKRKLAGAIGMSTWLSLRDKFPEALGPDECKCPILQFHGTNDEIVDYSLGLSTSATLIDFKRDAEFIAIDGMGHSVSVGEIEQAKSFLASVIGK